MFILSIEDQESVITQYQRDYGRLVLSYNDLGTSKTNMALKFLRMQAESLSQEIDTYTAADKRFFTQENIDFAHGLIKAIANLINPYH